MQRGPTCRQAVTGMTRRRVRGTSLDLVIKKRSAACWPDFVLTCNQENCKDCSHDAAQLRKGMGAAIARGSDIQPLTSSHPFVVWR